MKLLSINIDIKSSTLNKLIEVTTNAIGKLCAPALLREFAKAKGQEILTIGTSVKELKECLGSDAEVGYQGDNFNIRLSSTSPQQPAVNFARRIEDRLAKLESDRQRNLDKVTLFAIKSINYDKEPSGAPVDDDWASKFFSAAQHISNEEMQEVWGNILAMEVESPGSFSPRSLDTLRGLTRHEAEIFQHILKYKVMIDSEAVIIGNDISQVTPEGKRWAIILLMRELGLVQESTFIIMCQCDEETIVQHYGLKFRVNKKTGQEYKIYGCHLTRVGRELATLINHSPSDDFFSLFRESISKQGCDVDESI